MDNDRFERLYREHGPSVIRDCTFSAGGWQDGEDIAAEVFARMLTKGSELADERIAPWLFTVARNLCVSHHRSAVRQARVHRDLTETPSWEAPAWSDPAIWGYVMALKERARLVIYLHAVEERPFSQIARMTGMSQSAVKMTHYRALDRVRRAMEADGITSTADMLGGPIDA
jgi:RNA polymerase sigma factor (sigma-70 family)